MIAMQKLSEYIPQGCFVIGKLSCTCTCMYVHVHIHVCSHVYVRTSEFQPPELKSDEAVSHLDDVHQSVESVGGEDEEVPTGIPAPSPQQEVPTEALLEDPR